MNHQPLAQQLVKKCLARGADAAEVFVESARHLSIAIRNGAVETVEEAATAGVGLRVIVGGRLAFAHCNDLRPAALDSAVARAIEFGRVTTADPSNALPRDPGVTAVEGIYDPAIAKVAMASKIDLAQTVEKLAMSDPRIAKSAGANYGEQESEVWLANSNGLAKSYRSSGCGVDVTVVAVKGDLQSPGNESCARRFFGDLLPPAEIAGRAAKKALERLDPRPLKTQRAAVLVDPDVVWPILGGLLAALDGEAVLQGASFLAGQLGRSVASGLLTLVDDGTRPRGLASCPFDGEGVPTQKRTVVAGGVLQGFLYNTIVGQRAGQASTGNAARDGFGSLPGIGAHNFSMSAGATPAADVVKATRRGLWLKEVTGYGIDAVNGNFSGGAAGLWIENGEVAFPVRGLTIAGTAREMLEGIDLVGSEIDLDRHFAAPLFRIREMQIGGE
ncbi:MAG: TldD/PmbA family protein [Deltaproteobacteria bacterium]|nr:TldD/PmbA family protein [Deltaproteobacteria bacterium]